ncbi:MAG: GlsB/YeaQ/YmgE family stress response membrane protein [Acidimicrobiales bacterium]
MLLFLIGVAIVGLVVGALGRLIVPGPNPMGVLSTILVGLGGSFLGGLVGRLLFGLRFRYSFVLAVLAAALIVLALQGTRRASRSRRTYRARPR